jgi:uncharacterized protein YjaG (DUF416 family)
MKIFRYNERSLADLLQQLPPPFRTAFAAAAAERLFPTYVAFADRTGHGDPLKIRGILDRLWLDLEGKQVSAEQAQEDIDVCMSLIPQEDLEPWVVEQVYAENATAAVAYALTSRQTGETQEAIWAARQVYEALDHFIIARDRIDINSSGAEGTIMSHPLMQNELQRQDRDLRDLASGMQQFSSVAHQLCQRARMDSQTLFQA